MSRKDYEAIARAIARSRGHWMSVNIAVHAIEATAEQIAAALAGDNPRFDRERFLQAARGDT